MTGEEIINPAGQTFGHYRIAGKIGAGGMGEVYLAEDTRLDRRVAVKFLNEELSRDADKLRRFVQEAKAASALNHPNILTVYEIGESEGKNYIATEFIEGETLRERLRGREPLELNYVLGVGIQIAEALGAAHRAGIVHRDIKPENIMLREADELVKILDFGIAKLSEKKPEVLDAEAETAIKAESTSPGVIIGTANYMSPEQARGKAVDARSDIFSFGIVLYEMLAGKQAFAGETAMDTIGAILHKEPIPIKDLSPEIPTEIELIVSKTLKKEAGERYQTAKDLLSDLKQARQELEFQNKFKVPLSSGAKSAEANTQILEAKPTDEEKPSTNETPNAISSAEYIVREVKQHKRGFAAALMALLLAASVGFGWWFYANRQANTKQIESIAVLPFENASGNADLEYLSDGVSESVIDRLSQLPQLKVIARSSSFRYRGQNLNLQEIANALGVQAIVTGRVVPRGDSYQIRVELVDVREDKQVWGENFTRKISDVQILQTDISREIAENLRLRLSGTQTQQLAGQGTANPQAYELLLKGRFYFNKGGGQSGENFRKAIEYYEQAVAADPNYALAHAELSDAYSFGGGGVLDRKQRGIKQEAAARKALELDPNLADAHFAMAQSKRDNGEWAEAERGYKRAIELNPNLAKVYSAYANYLNLMKRPDEAVAAIRRALELAPLSIIFNVNAINVYYLARRYDEAIVAAKKAFELEPNNSVARSRLGNVYEAKGMYQETLAEYREVLRLRGNDARGEGPNFARVYAKMGERAKAEEILRKFKADGNNFGGRDFALVYDALGRRDEAFAELEKDYAENRSNLANIAANPLYDNLRSDPRFQDLLRRMSLPQ
jgi:eukaryotic-like serine/threonine-protein kinase